MRCNVCGTENPEGYAYCTKCGSPLSSSTPQRKVIDEATPTPVVRAKSKTPIIIGAIVAAVLVIVLIVVGVSMSGNKSQTATNNNASTTTQQAAWSNPFTGHSAGDIVSFGTYGGEDVTWRILEVKSGTALVITENVVEAVPYYNSYTATSWSGSNLRSWMNGTFYNSAFTSEDRAIICSTTVYNSANSTTGTSGGSTTTDYLFALNMDEAYKYFSSDSDRLATATSHAKQSGAQVISGSNATPWWLRTPGKTSRDASYVWGASGYVDYNGYGVNESTYGARPAMWVTL